MLYMLITFPKFGTYGTPGKIRGFVIMKLKNSLILNPDGRFLRGELNTDGELIGEQSGDEEVLDTGGLILTPGLVDLHLHGADGVDFMDGSLRSLRKLLAFEARNGSTTVCPATMTMAKNDIFRALSCAADYLDHEEPQEARLGGIYLEGPFISPLKCGAQDKSYVRSPSLDFLNAAQQAASGLIRLLALAPELPGSSDFIVGALKLYPALKICLGHSNCSYEEARQALMLGVGQVTHLFNALPPLLQRDPGPLAAIFEHPSCSAELICDGFHLHDAVIRLAFKVLGDNRIILISDSMMATGLDDGTYCLGGQEVHVKERRALLGDGTLAGSASTLWECVRHCVLSAGIPLESALKAACVNPAAAVGLTRCGSLKPGSYADVIGFDEHLELKLVLLRGEVILDRR